MVRFGIIGVGNMGVQHSYYLKEGKVENGVLTAVCDINSARLDWAKENLGDSVTRFDDAEEMMKSGLIDAVIVAVPHYDHPVLTIKAFEHNLHVICEKPAGVYTKQVKEMNDAAAKTDRVFSLMYNQRTHPQYAKAREMVQSGELGNLKRVIWIITNWFRTQSYYNSGGWRATWSGEGGGVLLNQCPHNLDLLQWICGMPSRARAFMSFGKYHDIEVEDEVTAYIEYDNGATGLFITTTGEAPGTNRLEIVGEKGKIVIEDNKSFRYFKNDQSDSEYSRSATSGFDKPKCEEVPVEMPDYEGSHHLITQNFVNAIEKGETLIAPGVEGINGLTISNAFHLSSVKEDWINIPMDDDEFLVFLDKKIKNSKYHKIVEEKTFGIDGTF